MQRMLRVRGGLVRALGLRVEALSYAATALQQGLVGWMEKAPRRRVPAGGLALAVVWSAYMAWYLALLLIFPVCWLLDKFREESF